MEEPCFGCECCRRWSKLVNDIRDRLQHAVIIKDGTVVKPQINDLEDGVWACEHCGRPRTYQYHECK